MDEEIKSLLLRIADKLEEFEARLKKVEAESHKQITLEDYFQKYGIPQPSWPKPPRHAPFNDPIWLGSPAIC